VRGRLERLPGDHAQALTPACPGLGTIGDMAIIPALSDAQRAFLDAPRFAAVATTDDDGAPRQTVVWYRLADHDRILLNGRLPRRWCANLARDRRVSLAIVDQADGYRWIGVTGAVEEIVEDDSAKEDIVALARRYETDGGEPDPAQLAAFRSQPRITYLVRITGLHDHLED